MLKILILGEEPTDFILPLVKDLKKSYGLCFGLFELRQKNLRNAFNDDCFIEEIELKSRKNIRAILSAVFSISFFQIFLSLKSFKNKFKVIIDRSLYKGVFQKYDVINFHSLTSRSLHFMEFVPADKKVIFSFWGSDLLNPSEATSVLIAKYIRRASKITLHTPEMREIFLSKYGRDLINKVKITLVVDNTNTLDEVIEQIPNKIKIIKEFKKKYSIPNESIIVTIGHSGHHIDNHLEIIKNLGSLSKEEKAKLYLVLPMTYGCSDPNYFVEIEKISQEFGLQCLIFKEFLSKKENIELRLISEIHVRLPKYDAFSLALSETVCSDNIIISAIWLPYGRLRVNGVYYKEISDYKQLAALVSNVLANYKTEQSKHQNNHKAVVKMFQQEHTTENFYNVLVN